MESIGNTIIEVEVLVKASIERVWESFISPEHITKWNFAHESWECPTAENDVQIGGKFTYNMAAKDGSFSFDFSGVYNEVKPKELLSITLEDGRKMKVVFVVRGNEVQISESFEAENENPIEMQKGGWQAILDNFKKYTEKLVG